MIPTLPVKPIKLHYHEWVNKFEPTTIDPIHELPEDTDPNYLWSELEGDDDDDGWTRVLIVEGNHPINNLGYYITKVPHNFNEMYEVE